MTWVCVGQEVPGTAFEQVYFGKAIEMYEISLKERTIELQDCQLCVFLSPTMKSWFELATCGPNDACRVSKPVKHAIIANVREMVECTEQAAQAWKSCPWALKLPQQIMHPGANMPLAS